MKYIGEGSSTHQPTEFYTALSEREIKLILGWFYAYPFTVSEQSKTLAKEFGYCIGELDVVDEA